MKHFFYPRLALSNIKKNAQIYLPYLLSSMFIVMMFYCMHSLSMNKGLKEDSTTAVVVLQLGVWVIMIFSVIFLFYINSFLMKRRKKEVALYNILGMEKKHITMMMFWETLFVIIVALIGGIAFGALFSKLMLLSLVKLMQLKTSINFTIPFDTICFATIFYTIIFVIAFMFNAIQIRLANPIELLRSGNVGEKEPKVKIIMTILGILTLGSGYYLAQTIEDPVAALTLFFVAVVLVIIGTYFLFTSGSIALLKVLKKNKRFYYQTRHFTSVSQLIYRMKQNAVGLASICILCTCILVMISSTVTLYLGIEDSVKIMQDESYRMLFYNERNSIKKDYIQNVSKDIQTKLKNNGIELETVVVKKVYDINVDVQGNKLVAGFSDSYCNVMTLDEYNEAYHKKLSLKDNEVLYMDNYSDIKDQIVFNDKTYQIKEVLHDKFFIDNEYNNLSKCIGVVFKDERILRNTIFNEDIIDFDPNYMISIDYKDNQDEEKADEIITNYINEQIASKHMCSYSSRFKDKKTFIDTYGSLFFLGIFLGIVFLMAAIIIMYYKQLSEGYEDQKRFEIMQNVGMSKKEVRQTIRSQVLIFFFVPLIVAVIHMGFAYKMIMKMFSYLILSESQLFMICTIISVIILAIIYSIVYTLTARTYYKIVKN